jgi:hypothetical protein
VGGRGRKFIDSKRTWLPDLVELLLEEEFVQFVLPASKLPTEGANDKGFTLSMPIMMDLGL